MEVREPDRYLRGGATQADDRASAKTLSGQLEELQGLTECSEVMSQRKI